MTTQTTAQSGNNERNGTDDRVALLTKKIEKQGAIVEQAGLLADETSKLAVIAKTRQFQPKPTLMPTSGHFDLRPCLSLANPNVHQKRLLNSILEPLLAEPALREKKLEPLLRSRRIVHPNPKPIPRKVKSTMKRPRWRKNSQSSM